MIYHIFYASPLSAVVPLLLFLVLFQTASVLKISLYTEESTLNFVDLFVSYLVCKSHQEVLPSSLPSLPLSLPIYRIFLFLNFGK